THAVTLVVILAMTVWAWRPPRAERKGDRWLGPAIVGVYLAHAAIIAGVDQLAVPSVAPFLAYCLGLAGIVVMSPRVVFAIYGGALALFVASIVRMQPAPTVRLALLPNGFSIVAVSVALACLLYAARRRDFAQRVTIDRQRDELARLNASL